MELPKAEISILLLNDVGISKLNKEYLKRTGPTDVISFPLHDNNTNPDIGPEILGDIVISVETAQRQALEKNHDLYREIACLLIHGTLHLLGYDHEISQQKYREMTEKEALVLEKISGKINLLRDAHL